MMRHARRASLLVAFSLLTSAATAYAECAWDAKSRCEEAKNERLRALSGTVKRKDVSIVCLPDTVDPRGPKVK